MCQNTYDSCKHNIIDAMVTNCSKIGNCLMYEVKHKKLKSHQSPRIKTSAFGLSRQCSINKL